MCVACCDSCCPPELPPSCPHAGAGMLGPSRAGSSLCEASAELVAGAAGGLLLCSCAPGGPLPAPGVVSSDVSRRCLHARAHVPLACACLSCLACLFIPCLPRGWCVVGRCQPQHRPKRLPLHGHVLFASPCCLLGVCDLRPPRYFFVGCCPSILSSNLEPSSICVCASVPCGSPSVAGCVFCAVLCCMSCVLCAMCTFSVHPTTPPLSLMNAWWGPPTHAALLPEGMCHWALNTSSSYREYYLRCCSKRSVGSSKVEQWCCFRVKFRNLQVWPFLEERICLECSVMYPYRFHAKACEMGFIYQSVPCFCIYVGRL